MTQENDTTNGSSLKLYWLQPIPSDDTVYAEDPPEWGGGGYDCVKEFLIAAFSEEDARNLAADHPGDEGSYVWLEATKTSCVLFEMPTAPRIIVRDYREA